ncbi:MAG: AbrB/MazE/SpoVT family DNA-binding domain-containing protein [Clostridiales bacterium]|nr:AbrB/MazE/SpoVT family DNA-binding domain-containing protein [Clostridiales bacterium]
MQPPKGKHVFGTVKVGEKGQIVIPRDARRIFNIKPGDTLLVLGDEAQGIAIVKDEILKDFLNRMLSMPDTGSDEQEG